MRKEGYYRVKLRTEKNWDIAYFDERFKSWHIVGDTKVYYDKEFLEIETEKILMP